jgi:hypothetical protein
VKPALVTAASTLSVLLIIYKSVANVSHNTNIDFRLTIDSDTNSSRSTSSSKVSGKNRLKNVCTVLIVA